MCGGSSCLARPRGDFDSERSDIDFLVEFDQSEPEALSLKTYLDLKDSLEAVLGRPVDPVEPNALRNPYLRGRGSQCLRRDSKSLPWDAKEAADAIASMTAGKWRRRATAT